MKIIRTLTLASLLAGASTLIQAKAPKAPPPQKADKVEAYLKAHDKNHDGYIDKSEFAGTDFAKWDTNHDGKLDRSELTAMLNPPKKGK